MFNLKFNLFYVSNIYMPLTDKIKKELLKFQIEHTENLIHILNKNTTALDASETGTGKTYCAIAACAALNMRPIIICPKSIIYNWKRVCKIFGVKPIIIVNYESIRSGKCYNEDDERQVCPYLMYIPKKGSTEMYYEWQLDKIKEKVIFIFDEVHKCSSVATLNGKLLYYTKLTEKNILILSATIADHPEKFKLFFYILNFIDPQHVKEKQMTFNQYMMYMHSWIMRDAKPMYRIYVMLYPDRATRMRIEALGKEFPETQITAIPYSMGKDRELEIERAYKEIADSLDDLRKKETKERGNILVKIMRAHQKIELLKVPTFVELTNDYIENGYSVVIFVNFTDSLKKLSKLLMTDCLIYGDQTGEDREKNIQNFQNNRARVIICNLKAGSLGVSLHDLDGKHPRVSIISPTWSSIDLTQALGRIHRASGKSKSLQRIIYAANTIEEKIADKLQKKLKDMNDLNNGDLDLTNIVFEKERRSKLGVED
jgi:superfamily II DNA or RNA helicase